jgi:hypothetical protein
MSRALALVISTILAVGLAVTTAPQMASAEGIIRPHMGMNDCPEAATGIQTIPSTDQEAEYNDDLTVCDWGPFFDSIFDQRAQFSFTNDSPVVWAFYDAVQTNQTPLSSLIYYNTSGITPMFRQFAFSTQISPTDWIVSPKETVWLSSLDNVAFTPADPSITSSWLLYKQQANKIKSLGTAYAKRIATRNYESKTRTFLWNCVAAGITTENALKTNFNNDALGSASSWLSSAKDGSQCIDSFNNLFRKKLTNHPQITSDVSEWFSTSKLTEASGFVAKIKSSDELLETIIGVFHAAR